MSVNTNQLAEDFILYISDVRGFSPATTRTYSYVLNCFVSGFTGDLQEMTIDKIDTYISDFTKLRKLKPASSNTVRCVLRSFFMYVDKYRDIRLKFDYAMIRQVKAPRQQINFVTPEKAQQIISKLHTHQDKLMVLTMFSTGLRIGELIKLQVEDVHAGEITVRGKGGKNRVIPIEDTLGKELRHLVIEHNLRTGPLFRHQVDKPSLKNQNYSSSGIRNRLKRQLGPFNLYIKPHAFRHGIATSLLMNGMDIRTLQTFLGHTHIATTMLYTHVTDSHLRESYLKHTPTTSFNLRNMLDT